MKSLQILTLCSIAIFGICSCTKTKGEITMTYTKATAVYGNIEELRATPLVSSVKSIDHPGKIYIDDDVMLIGEKEEGIHVYDNSNSNSPEKINFIELPMNREFYVDGNMIYAESHYDFVKIDISDKYNPKLISRVEFAFGEDEPNDQGEHIIGFHYETVTESFELGSPEAEALEESTYLYYNYMDKLIPVSSVPSSFVSVSSDARGTLNKIATLDDYVYVVGDGRIYSFSNELDEMHFSNRVELYTSGIETIYPSNGSLYVGTQSSMMILDASNPATPYIKSSYWHPTSCDPVLPHGNIAYLTLRSADNSGCAGDDNTLTVIDVTDEYHPQQINTITMESPYGMGIDQQYLWVGEGSNGLTLFDNSVPASPQRIKTFSNVTVYDIIPNPNTTNTLYTTGDGGLNFYEVDYSNLTLTPIASIKY